MHYKILLVGGVPRAVSPTEVGAGYITSHGKLHEEMWWQYNVGKGSLQCCRPPEAMATYIGDLAAMPLMVIKAVQT
jgi:hypothetical protein